MKILGRRDRWDDIAAFRNHSPWLLVGERDGWYADQGERPRSGDMVTEGRVSDSRALLHDGSRWVAMQDSFGYAEFTVPATTAPNATVTRLSLSKVHADGFTLSNNQLVSFHRTGYWVWTVHGNFSRSQAGSQRFLIGLVGGGRVQRNALGYAESYGSTSAVQYMHADTALYFEVYQNSGFSATFTGKAYGKWLGDDPTTV